MYYIGYTSVISGGDDGRIFEYLEWTYGAEDDTEDVTEYPEGYFFSGDPEDEDYILTVPAWFWIVGLLAICAFVFLFFKHKAAKEKLYN